MSEHRPNPIQDEDEWAMRVETTAHAFDYPPTPDLTPAVRVALRRRPTPVVVRRMAQAALILLLIVVAMIAAVPSIRAEVLKSLRLGAVEIFVATPTATPTPQIVTQTPRPRPTSRLEPTPLQSALDLPNEISLADAQARLPQLVRLPSDPPDLGAPDRVFSSGQMLTFVWTEASDPSSVRLVLSIMRSVAYGEKLVPYEPENTLVGSVQAYWFVEPHLVFSFPENASGVEIHRQVTAHTLLWYASGLTYRLETALDKDEAIRIAESIQ